MLRLSPFEIEYEDMQKNNHAIAPTVLKKKRDKAKAARKKSLDEVLAEQATCILT